MTILTAIILSITLSTATPAQQIEAIQTTGTGALITFGDGTGYYYEF